MKAREPFVVESVYPHMATTYTLWHLTLGGATIKPLTTGTLDACQRTAEHLIAHKFPAGQLAIRPLEVRRAA